jgi:hypothetical protein
MEASSKPSKEPAGHVASGCAPWSRRCFCTSAPVLATYVCTLPMSSTMPGSRRGGPASEVLRRRPRLFYPAAVAGGRRGCKLTVDVERASTAPARDGDGAPAWEGNVGFLCSWRPHLLWYWSGRGRPAGCGSPSTSSARAQLRCGAGRGRSSGAGL